MVTRRTLFAMTGGALLNSALPVLAGGGQIIGGTAFASWWRASLPPDCDPTEMRATITRVFHNVDEAMSPYKGASELSRLNRSPAGHWLPISEDTSQVVSESLRVANATEGAFDPTVGPLVRRYGFGPIRGATSVDFRSIVLGERGVIKKKPGVTLDLCGIAKGYALDRLAEAVLLSGVSSFLLEAGGEILARGRHPDGRPWQVGIETPGSFPVAFQRIVRLDDMALATSGNQFNGGAKAGVYFNHIVDARVDRPITNNVASVSVIAATAMQADALATALYVLGAENGLELAKRLNLAALYQLREGREISEVMSERFARHIVA